MSHRIAQIESTMKRALSQVLQRDISDPRIEGMVSITEVKVAPDLSEAYVSISVLPTEKQTKTLYGLRHAASHIHSKLNKHLRLRQIPQLHFRLDESLKKQAEVYDAINKAMDRTGDAPVPDAPVPDEPDAETEQT